MSAEHRLSFADVNEDAPRNREQENEAIIAGFRDLLHNGEFDLYREMLDVTYDAERGPESNLTYWQRAVRGGREFIGLRRKLDPGIRPAQDPEYLSKMYDVLAVVDPLAYTSTSGNEALVLKALVDARSNPTLQDYQERVANSEAMGVFLLTEASVGSNASKIQTTVTIDAERGVAVLNTPSDEACKFMPNIADEGMPKVTVVAARLIADGRDQGVALVTVPMHTDDEPSGISMEIMGDKSLSTPMPHAERIRYDNVELSLDNIILGQDARIEHQSPSRWQRVRKLMGRKATQTESWHYHNDTPLTGDDAVDKKILNERYHKAIAPLGWGRLGLVSGSIAAAWAALSVHIPYAHRREVGGGKTLAEQDDWQYDIARAVIDACAFAALSGAIRRRFANNQHDALGNELLVQLEKPLVTARARAIIMTCADRTGARGHFDSNLFAGWQQIVQGALTAEGERNALERSSGLGVASAMMNSQALPVLAEQLPAERPWWDELVAARADNLLQTPDFALGINGQAAHLSRATAQRYALDSLVEAAEKMTGPAKKIARTIADLYALESIGGDDSNWYWMNRHMTPERALEAQAAKMQKYQEILPHLSTIVDAFGIPRGLLGAPITADNYVAARTR